MSSSRVLARLRRRRGLSQETLAERLSIHVSTLARWERRRTTPSPAMRGPWAVALGIGLDELDAHLAAVPSSPAESADLAPVRAVHEWLVTPPPQFCGPRRSRPVDEAVLVAERDRLRAAREADDRRPGGVLHPVLRGEIQRITAWRDGLDHESPSGREVLRLSAQWQQLASWSAADAGNRRWARAHGVAAIRAAHAAGDVVLAAEAVSTMSYLLAEENAGAEAVLLARSALHRLDEAGAVGNTARMRALVRARLVWAHVVAGDPSEADRQLVRARAEFAARDTDDSDPPWLYWLSEPEFAVIVGRAATALGRGDLGVSTLSEGMTHRQRPDREHVLYTTWLAHAYWSTGERDTAMALASRARARAVALDSAFCARAVAGVREMLAAG